MQRAGCRHAANRAEAAVIDAYDERVLTVGSVCLLALAVRSSSFLCTSCAFHLSRRVVSSVFPLPLPVSALSINGELTRGQDVRSQNVMAVVAIANILKSSLGPVGLDKMLVDELGDMTVTNDGATILKNLEVEHPAAKVLVELSNLQDQEVSSGRSTIAWPAAVVD